jgi:hypothetical protein
MSGRAKARRAVTDMHSQFFVFIISPLRESRFVLGWAAANQTELERPEVGWDNEQRRVYVCKKRRPEFFRSPPGGKG